MRKDSNVQAAPRRRRLGAEAAPARLRPAPEQARAALRPEQGRTLAWLWRCVAHRARRGRGGDHASPQRRLERATRTRRNIVAASARLHPELRLRPLPRDDVLPRVRRERAALRARRRLGLDRGARRHLAPPPRLDAGRRRGGPPRGGRRGLRRRGEQRRGVPLPPRRVLLRRLWGRPRARRARDA